MSFSVSPREEHSTSRGQSRRPGRGRVFLTLLLSLGLSACSFNRSLERSSDGSTLYLDQLSAEAKAEERGNIVRSLAQDVALFQVSIGDQIKVFFDVNPAPTPTEYVISVGDKLRIEFLDDPAHNATVTVRPDGRISLPEIGSLMATGRTGDALAGQIRRRYAGIRAQSSFPIEPEVTVDVTESHSPLDRFIAMIGQSRTNLSLTTKVLPDGTMSLPLLPPIAARGYPLEQLEHNIDNEYSALGLGVSVSLIPYILRTGSTMVIGEVPKPGRIALDRPHTVLMAVAQAGGVLPTGSMKAVRVVYVANDDRPRLRVINLKEVISDLKLEDDMIVPDNSVIYVPPTELTKVNRIVRTIAEILQIQGVGFSGAYIINQPTAGVSPIPTK